MSRRTWSIIRAAILLALAIFFFVVSWGFWRDIGKPLVFEGFPDFVKYPSTSSILIIPAVALLLFGAAISMFWVALRGDHTGLSLPAQRWIVLGLSVLWLCCLTASFTVVKDVDAFAPAVHLVSLVCPVVIITLLLSIWEKRRGRER